ncbi:hypothetical protein [Streptosporangium sp. NPDC020145]|uniref:hypothetical protein n=1 Tax=Streptosporangium sp. NPDC020145 TaxID=3154694 RepID=UPI00342E1A23
MLQQFAIVASREGRTVHLLQWDVVRGAFEGHPAGARYPEVDGVTHAAVRRAVGLWARRAVSEWDRRHPGGEHLLAVEAPLIGDRLASLARVRNDEAEALLGGTSSTFFVPAPSDEVRRAIESSRIREARTPRHERERANAAPPLLELLWQDVVRLGVRFGLAEQEWTGRGYQRDLYVSVYRRLLRDRTAVVLEIDDVLPVTGSPYAFDTVPVEILPSHRDVDDFLTVVSSLPNGRLRQEAEQWYGDVEEGG